MQILPLPNNMLVLLFFFSPRVIFNACMSSCVFDLVIDIAVGQVQWHSVAQFTWYCTPLEHIQLGWGRGRRMKRIFSKTTK
jgi:hypothetical protein